MIIPQTFTYYDFRQGIKSQDIGLLFPDWQGKQERVAVVCAHDDDGVIGAGYLILAAIANGAQVYQVIFCDGCFGYSTLEEKETIRERRRLENIASCHILGIVEENIIRFGYHDFSLLPNMGWYLSNDQLGTMARFLPAMRKISPTRLALINGYREHIDHETAFRIGAFDGPQLGDPIIAEYRRTPYIRTYLQYATWGDFSPEDALVKGVSSQLRANRAIQVPLEVEERVRESIQKYESQQQIISGILKQRLEGRFQDGKGLELYQVFDPRPPLDFKPYHHFIKAINSKDEGR
jgi:LmbE family N-acetylglucosaminyl deacetylase